MNERSSNHTPAAVYILLTLIGVAFVRYLGWPNGLIFDDARLLDGTVTNIANGSPFFRLRLVSYESFNIINHIFGDQLIFQRAFNVLLHLLNCGAIYLLFKSLAIQHHPNDTMSDEGRNEFDIALLIGVSFYAIHPMNVYAVDYLIQRSIIMATLFGVLSCWAFATGLQAKNTARLVISMLFYVIAVLCKEHAMFFLLPLLCIYLYITKPTKKAIALGVLTASVLIGIAYLIVQNQLPNLIGKPFDERSLAIASQLDMIASGSAKHVYVLSAINEMCLFFLYGALWLIPYTGWMSIDIRTPLPTASDFAPQLIGAVGFIIFLGFCIYIFLSKKTRWSFAGLCLLFPITLYMTELGTVWIQDPFVIYRSYMWAISLPALFALCFSRLGASNLYKIGALALIPLGIASAERVNSLQNEFVVWGDAIEKFKLFNGPTALGKSRGYMNRGMEHLKRGNIQLAMADFLNARAVGDIDGEANFAIGMAQNASQQFDKAIVSLRAARAEGYKSNLLDFYMGEALNGMNRPEAVEHYTTALNAPLDELPKRQAHFNRAEINLKQGNYQAAYEDYNWLVQNYPGEVNYKHGYGFSLIGTKNYSEAQVVFSELIINNNSAIAFYGRAIANNNLGYHEKALDDISQAIAKQPGNEGFISLQKKIRLREKLEL